MTIFGQCPKTKNKQESPVVGNCKRHTTHGITCPGITYPGGVPHPRTGVPHLRVPPILTWQGVPRPRMGVGTPHPDLAGEVPHPTMGRYPFLGYLPILTLPKVTDPRTGGTPSQDGGTLSWGTPILMWPVTGVPPGKGMGQVEVLWDGGGVPPGC